MVWGAVIAAGASYLGARKQNKENKREAARNRQFQQKNSDTAHQREIADLKAAGLNPILSSKYGGASTPGGNMARIENEMEPAINSAQNQRRLKADLKLLKEQTDKTHQDRITQSKLGNLYTVQNQKAAMETKLLEAQLPEAEINAAFYDSQGGEFMKLMQKWGITPSTAKLIRQLMSKSPNKGK